MLAQSYDISLLNPVIYREGLLGWATTAVSLFVVSVSCSILLTFLKAPSPVPLHREMQVSGLVHVNTTWM